MAFGQFVAKHRVSAGSTQQLFIVARYNSTAHLLFEKCCLFCVVMMSI